MHNASVGFGWLWLSSCFCFGWLRLASVGFGCPCVFGRLASLAFVFLLGLASVGFGCPCVFGRLASLAFVFLLWLVLVVLVFLVGWLRLAFSCPCVWGILWGFVWGHHLLPLWFKPQCGQRCSLPTRLWHSCAASPRFEPRGMEAKAKPEPKAKPKPKAKAKVKAKGKYGHCQRCNRAFKPSWAKLKGYCPNFKVCHTRPVWIPSGLWPDKIVLPQWHEEPAAEQRGSAAASSSAAILVSEPEEPAVLLVFLKMLSTVAVLRLVVAIPILSF
jgi:hypothetical protein